MKDAKRLLMVSIGVSGAVFVLSACSSVQDAIDGAQSVVSTAQAINEACSEASAAWAPGATATEAAGGLTAAVDSLSAALAADPSLPGAGALLEQLEQALVEVEQTGSDAASLLSTEAVKFTCSSLGIQE